MYNKETSILLLLVFAVTHWDRLERPRWMRHLLAQGVICAAVFALTWVLARGNPGSLVEEHFARNRAWLSENPSHYFHFAWMSPTTLFPHGLPVPIPEGINLPMLLLVGGVVAWRWGRKPEFLRRALPVVLIPLVGLTLFLGYLDELRDYYEAFPIVLLLVYSTFSKAEAWRRASAAANGPTETLAALRGRR